MNKLAMLYLAAAILTPLAGAHAASNNAVRRQAPITAAAGTAIPAIVIDPNDRVAALQSEVTELNEKVAALQLQNQNSIQSDSAYQQDVPRGD